MYTHFSYHTYTYILIPLSRAGIHIHSYHGVISRHFAGLVYRAPLTDWPAL